MFCEMTARLRTYAARALVAVLLLGLYPVAARACPVCFAASSPRVLNSYIVTAALLTLLPFTIIGAGVALAMYIRRHSQVGATSD